MSSYTRKIEKVLDGYETLKKRGKRLYKRCLESSNSQLKVLLDFFYFRGYFNFFLKKTYIFICSNLKKSLRLKLSEPMRFSDFSLEIFCIGFLGCTAPHMFFYPQKVLVIWNTVSFTRWLRDNHDIILLLEQEHRRKHIFVQPQKICSCIMASSYHCWRP